MFANMYVLTIIFAEPLSFDAAFQFDLKSKQNANGETDMQVEDSTVVKLPGLDAYEDENETESSNDVETASNKDQIKENSIESKMQIDQSNGESSEESDSEDEPQYSSAAPKELSEFANRCKYIPIRY
jgi:hypothetical protein